MCDKKHYQYSHHSTYYHTSQHEANVKMVQIQRPAWNKISYSRPMQIQHA